MIIIDNIYIYGYVYGLHMSKILGLRRVLEKAINAVPPSGQPLWPLGVVMDRDPTHQICEGEVYYRVFLRVIINCHGKRG